MAIASFLLCSSHCSLPQSWPAWRRLCSHRASPLLSMLCFFHRWRALTGLAHRPLPSSFSTAPVSLSHPSVSLPRCSLPCVVPVQARTVAQARSCSDECLARLLASPSFSSVAPESVSATSRAQPVGSSSTRGLWRNIRRPCCHACPLPLSRCLSSTPSWMQLS